MNFIIEVLHGMARNKVIQNIFMCITLLGFSYLFLFVVDQLYKLVGIA